MSGYTLAWKSTAPLASTDGPLFRPDTLGVLPLDQLQCLRFRNGRQESTLSDFFTIDGAPGPRLTIRNTPPLDRLGAGMKDGTLIIEGNAGDDLGASMRGGMIQVQGNVGHRAGGPDGASDRGMTGGEIIIGGDAGDYAGLRMRRGLIVVRGRTGKSPGYRMMAGTIVLGRGPAADAGLEMRRGTILCLDRSAQKPVEPAFALDGVFDTAAVPVMRLLFEHLRGRGLLHEAAPNRLNLYSGDRFELSKGEIWQPA